MKNNEGILNRREFFKITKRVLPVLGLFVLSQIPATGLSHESKLEMGCNTGCRGGCRTLCEEGCSHSCNGGCKTTCEGHCKNGCGGTATTYSR